MSYISRENYRLDRVLFRPIGNGGGANGIYTEIFPTLRPSQDGSGGGLPIENGHIILRPDDVSPNVIVRVVEGLPIDPFSKNLLATGKAGFKLSTWEEIKKPKAGEVDPTTVIHDFELNLNHRLHPESVSSIRDSFKIAIQNMTSQPGSSSVSEETKKQFLEENVARLRQTILNFPITFSVTPDGLELIVSGNVIFSLSAGLQPIFLSPQLTGLSPSNDFIDTHWFWRNNKYRTELKSDTVKLEAKIGGGFTPVGFNIHHGADIPGTLDINDLSKILGVNVKFDPKTILDMIIGIEIDSLDFNKATRSIRQLVMNERSHDEIAFRQYADCYVRYEPRLKT